MDANGLRFWMLANEEEWRFAADSPPLAYDPALRCLRLASRRRQPLPAPADRAADRARAEELLAQIPQARDGYQTRAYWDEVRGQVMATGALAGSVPIFAPPAGHAPTDLAMGFDGVLYLAIDGAVVMHDLRKRWETATVLAQGLTAWRLAPDPAGGVWVLDRAGRNLARLSGTPLPADLRVASDAETFHPLEPNPDPPRLERQSLSLLLDETPVAIACHPLTGAVDLLCWMEDAEATLYRNLQAEPQRVTLAGAHHPYTLAWAAGDRLAVRVPGLPGEALVYPPAPGATRIEAIGDFYPLRGGDGPFAHVLDLPAHYVNTDTTAPLLPLSLSSYHAEGEATPPRAFDSGSAETVWHRLYLEAVLPPNCGVRVLLAATDQPAPPAAGEQWHEHRFGRYFAQPGMERLPRGAWSNLPSEIPYHPGFLPCASAREEAGLFGVLIQRSGRRVSTLRGRYLHLRVILQGDGRNTPEVYALRAYASRFSYVSRYLPALYHETLFGPDADALASPATPRSPADFLERFVDNFEGILTPLEDRIAQAYLLTDPRSAPPEALAWLGSWIGLAFSLPLPVERRRALLRAAPALFRRRGTLAGLRLALELYTGGAVSGGELVVVEDWRLRRAFVTILGADLADETDPLLAGMAVSGNSFVGDTLFLGDLATERRKEFLALFAADLSKQPSEAAAVQQFLDRLAYRVTVLVHQEVAPQELGLIRQVVEMEKPAHVEAKVLPASEAFRVGIAALVGVDSYLAPEPPPAPVRVDGSYVGVRDRILRPVSLDPRLEG